MRRLLAGTLAFAGFTGTFLVLPVYAAPGPEPVPVAGDVDEVAMGSVADPAPTADVQAGTTDPVGGVPSSAPALTVTRTDVDEFSLVGVSWALDPEVTDTVVQVRVQDGAGEWGGWTEVAAEDAGQDPGADTGRERRGGTAPLWTGPSTAVQAELVTRSGARPTDVQLDLVDPGDSAADAAPGQPEIQDTADAAMAMPDVYSRKQWGADERLRSWDPEYASTIKAAALHHTAGSNNYTADQVPDILRSIYTYHAKTLGWGDIGYNVLVDKFGRLWEGRYGGLASTVVGAHAGGFNTYTFGVSMIGNHDTVQPAQSTVDAVARIIAWKFSLFNVDPRGSTTLTSAGGGTAKYAKGTRVPLPTIFGHRDVGATACPGQYGYGRLDEIRSKVSTALPAPTPAARYDSDAALRALLGAPVGAVQTVAGVTWQEYQHGRLYASWATGVHAVTGAILAKYLDAGGPAALGGPTTDVTRTPDGYGRYVQFPQASIYSTTATGTRLVVGQIRLRWAGQGWERGSLGYPTSDELVAPDGRVRYTTFQRGTVLWSSATGAHSLLDPIEDRWQALGGPAWRQGAATAEQRTTPDGLGRYSFFETGAAIYWTRVTGAHSVVPEVARVWGALGWERGIGYPTAEEAPTAGGAGSVTGFQRGNVYRSGATGAHSVYGSILARYLTLGGPTSRLGLPTRDEYGVPGGRRTDFQHGTLTWNARTGAVTAAYR